MRAILLASLLATACYDAGLDGFACGAGNACPDGYRCVRNTCSLGGAEDPDAAPTLAGPDAAPAGPDLTPPTVTFRRQPPRDTNHAVETADFAADEPATFRCSYDQLPFASCTPPVTTPMLDDGAHTLDVVAVDRANNLSLATRAQWTVDLIPPTTTIASGPAAVSGPDVVFNLSAESGSSFLCSLDSQQGGAFVPCTPPVQYTGLPGGNRTFRALAVDRAGNRGPESAPYPWTVDPTAFSTAIAAGPGSVSGPNVSFQFSATRAGASFECSLDPPGAPAFAACQNPQPYGPLAAGAHTLHVRARDAGGPATEASQTWTVDDAGPAVALSAPVSGSVTGPVTDARFSSEPGARFACRLDGAAAVDCVSPFQVGALADGAHTFTVGARDEVDNLGPTATVSWRVDAVAPTTTITGTPAAGAITTNTATNLALAASELGAVFECSFDGAPFAPCASPLRYTALGEGMHTLLARAVDAVGNVGQAAVHTFVVDVTPPTVHITSQPPAATPSGSVSYAFVTSEGTPECRLGTSGPFTPCTTATTMVYSGLADGSYSFTVRAADAAGNIGSAGQVFTVDTVAPVISLTTTPPAQSASATASFQWSVNEPATAACALDGAAPTACASPTTTSYAGLIEGDHSFTVGVADPAGNHAVETWTWHVDLTPPVVTFTATPPGSTNATSATFTFTVSKGQVFCADESGVFGNCSTPTSMTFTGLNEGWHVLRVRAVDGFGRAGETSYGWEVDLTPPELTVDGPTCGLGSPTYTWSALDYSGASVACGTHNPCANPYRPIVPYGFTTTHFTATDGAGNTTVVDMGYTRVHDIRLCSDVEP